MRKTLKETERIINRLYENEKTIIITTNCKSGELKANLGSRGPAILRRISSMCRPIGLTGEDWRVKHERTS